MISNTIVLFSWNDLYESILFYFIFKSQLQLSELEVVGYLLQPRLKKRYVFTYNATIVSRTSSINQIIKYTPSNYLEIFTIHDTKYEVTQIYDPIY